MKSTSFLINRVRTSEFARNVRVLFTGSLGAQLIGFATLPFLTRLYEPKYFSMLALFMAFVSTIAPSVSGRYDIAVTVASKEKDTRRLIVVSIWVSFITSCVLLILFAAFKEPLTEFLNASTLGFWWLLIPLTIFISATLNTFKYLATRLKNYIVLSNLVLYQAIFGAFTSIILGLLGFKDSGLLFSAFISLNVGMLYIFFMYKQYFMDLNWRPSKSILNTARQYIQFPVYSSIPTMFDSLLLALPVFFLGKYYSESIVGQYFILSRVSLAPLNLLGQATSQVHLQKITELVNEKKDATKYLIRLSLILSLLAFFIALIFMLFSEDLFGLMFGSEWRLAGFLLCILAPAIAIRFVVSTVSEVFPGTGNNHLSALWTLSAFGISFMVYWFAAQRYYIDQFFMIMTATDIFLYAIYYYLILYAVKYPKQLS